MASDDSNFQRERFAQEAAEAEAIAAQLPESRRIPAEQPRQSALWVVLSGWLTGLEEWLRSHGGQGLRWWIRAFWGFVAAVGIFLLIGPIINKPLSLEDITGSAKTATDTWIARNFEADYRFTLNDDGALIADVEERITAFFPNDVDESGIERVLATQYEGHSLNPSEISVTFDGDPVQPELSEDPTTLTVAIDAGTRLQGDHEVVLRYRLHDLAFSSTDEATGRTVDLLTWDVFGPDWGQGLAGLDVTVTIPQKLDDALVRTPRGSLAWLLIGAGDWLTPEDSPSPDEISYGFSNDQNIPPYAQAWFTLPFQAGSITLPPPSPLYWAQIWGPIAPLAFLLITLLLSFAARAVAWSDARGRPWYVSQYEPPKGVSVREAAQILRSPRTMELGESLATLQKSGRGRWRKSAQQSAKREALVAAARVAARAGRAGDRWHAFRRFAGAPERAAQLKDGFRRIPRGFVRDSFIAAPLALTIVQWGLIRQLSEQVVLSVVWWPFVFVVASSVISAIVLWIALRARPLTTKGALVKQHLQGIHEYAEQAQLLDRGLPTEPVLPYAVLTAPPREAGAKVAALVEEYLGDPTAADDWRTSDYVSVPRILVRALSLLLVAGAFTVAYTQPEPYPRSAATPSYDGDVPGNYWTTVTAIDIAGDLSSDIDGRARIDVEQNLTVAFDNQTSRIPQFAQQWQNSINGQSLDLRIETVTVDGEDAPCLTSQVGDTLLLQTTLVDALSGDHEVDINYSIGSAAVATEDAEGTVVDRVRWAALLEGWRSSSQWGWDAPDPVRISLSVPDDLAASGFEAGWITQDTDSGEEPRDWKDDVIPFGQVEISEHNDTSESQSAVPGGRVYVLDLVESEEGGWPFELTMDDLGASIDFPAGTFTGPDPAALQRAQWQAVAPVLLVGLLSLVGVAFGLIGTALGQARSRWVFRKGMLRDLVRWLAPTASLAAAVLFVWISADMVADHPVLPLTGFPALAAVGCSILGLIMTRSGRLKTKR